MNATDLSRALRRGLTTLACRRLPPLVAQKVRGLIYPVAMAYDDDCRFETRGKTGASFGGRTGDYYSYCFWAHGYYEWRLWAIALAVCEPGDTIVEIGANVGTETIGFADIVGPRGRVVAFEPLPELFSQLSESIRRNRFEHVDLWPFAVGDACRIMSFTLPTQDNSGLGHFSVDGESSQASLPVQCVRLDDLATCLGPARLLLADIEGAEPAMLRGGRSYIARHRPYLVLEVHAKNLTRYGLAIADVVRELDRLDYEPRIIGRFGFKPIELHTSELSNWFCCPRSETATFERVESLMLRCGLRPFVGRLNPLSFARRA